MPDLGDELRATIDGAATPVTFEEVVDRSSTRGSARRPWRTFVATAVVVVLVIVGAVVVANLNDDSSSKPHIAAPSVVVPDVDLAVLSTGFDDDGARGPIAPEVLDAVRAVPGVAGAQGAMQRFVDVVRTDTSTANLPDASERSAIAISWEEGAPLAFSAGGPPQASGEIAINSSLAAQYQVGVGDNLLLRTGSTMESSPTGSLLGTTVRVVGVFAPAGGEVEDINLVVMRAEDLGTATNRPSFDRIDIVATHDVPVDELLDRVAAVLPSSAMVVPPSVVGFDEQLRAELEIQRAYHWVLNPNHDLGRGATFGGSDDPAVAAQNQATYDANYWQTKNTELRVYRVAFVDSQTALVTYRAYYGGQPSQVVNQPMTAVAERIDGQWRISAASMCELAQASNNQCAGPGGPTAVDFTTPPNGWNSVTSVPGLADAFRVVANPSSTVDQRLTVVDQGEKLRDAIEAGVRADGQRPSITFNVSGVRLLDASHAQVLYSVIADGDPHLETPYPLVGNAVLVDGAWKVSSRFACGVTALATLKCPAAAALPTTTLPPTSTSTSTSTTSSTTSTTAPSTTTTSEVPTTTLVAPTSTAP